MFHLDFLETRVGQDMYEMGGNQHGKTTDIQTGRQVRRISKVHSYFIPF